MLRLKHILPFLILILSGRVNYVDAQTNQLSGYDTLSLADLMQVKVTVASIKELTTQESPGIISILTESDIRNSGAKDLMDLLQFIPGFQFGTDVQGALGLGVRGNWSHEGKVMLLIDGQDMSDGLYSTLQFGNHYPVDHIERIEIIRGPGSALYGGYAAYAVINVISKHAEEHSVTDIVTTMQGNTDGFCGLKSGIFAGYKHNKFGFSLDATSGDFERSQSTYTDVYGTTFDMHRHSSIKNEFINTAMNYGNLSARFISDQYTLQSADQYLEVMRKAYPVTFNSYYGELKYDYKVSEKMKITPRFNYRFQEPWKITGVDSPDVVTPLNMSSRRLTGSVLASADISDRLNLSGGISYFDDLSENHIAGEVFNTTGLSTLSYSNTGMFLQAVYQSKIANVIGGLYYNNNSLFDAALAPRIGFTREFNNWHLKVLYSHNFRSPSTQNIDVGDHIRPEKTDVYEMEIGTGLGTSSYITLNAFRITTTLPIIFYFDTTTNFDAYKNFSRTGSSGLELVYRLKKTNGGLDASASYYFAEDGANFTNFSAPGYSAEHLGLAPMKLTLSTYYKTNAHLMLHMSCIHQSERSAITGLNTTDGSSLYKRLSTETLLNLGISTDHLFSQVVSGSLYINNLLNKPQVFVQPYNSNHAPLPGLGINLQVTLRFTFN